MIPFCAASRDTLAALALTTQMLEQPPCHGATWGKRNLSYKVQMHP